MLEGNAGKPRGILYPKFDDDRLNLTRVLPAEDLGLFIEHFWSVQWNLPDGESHAAENLPHPSVHLVVEGATSRLYGIVTGKFTRTLKGKGGVFGIKFKPAGFYPFVRKPMSRLTDQIFHPREFFGSAAETYEREILLCNGDKAMMVACAEQFLREHLPGPDETVAQVNDIVNLVGTTREILKVDDLVARVNMSKRTLQRLFQTYVGVNPKWIIQRYRLLEAVEQLNNGNSVDYAQLALDLGYFDQAHFIKDFKAMTGRTPEEYARKVVK